MKKYFQDKTILLLLVVNLFLAILQIVLILINLNNQAGNANLTQYRPNLGLSAFTYSSSNLTYIGFIVFAIAVLALHTRLSVRMFAIRRHLSVMILALGTVLLLFSLRAGYALVVQ